MAVRVDVGASDMSVDIVCIGEAVLYQAEAINRVQQRFELT